MQQGCRRSRRCLRSKSLTALPMARHHQCCLRRQVCAHLHREVKFAPFKARVLGDFYKGKAKRAGFCTLLPATALSPVRRWSHSLDPTRISGKQKSCCSPFPTGKTLVADGPQRPGGLLCCSGTVQGLLSTLLNALSLQPDGGQLVKVLPQLPKSKQAP